MSIIVSADGREPELFPVGSGLAAIGAAMMILGAWGPWVSGHLLGGRSGLDLGGDGWLLVVAAAAAMLPLLLALPPTALKGLWVLAFAGAGGYVCAVHFGQAGSDGFRVSWGLDVAAAGAAILALGGLRLLVPRARA